jgi:hypothetical protein
MQHWELASSHLIFQCAEFATMSRCLASKLVAQKLVIDAKKAAQRTKIDAFSNHSHLLT